MKKLYFLLLSLALPFFLKAQEPTTTTNSGDQQNVQQMDDRSRSVFIGGVVVDKKNYQQIGIKGDIPIGKLGLGVDINLLIDKDGNIRKEDWKEWTDYLDKIYYIRWAHKGDPFYFKFGGLNYSYIGYRNIINGYSNMLEYPTYKRYGLEMQIQAGKFGMELFANDFKELFRTNASIVAGARMTYKVAGDLTVGATLVRDFNQYNGLRDRDGDGTPDQVDKFPYDAAYATQWEQTKYIDQSKGDSEADAIAFANKAYANNLISDNITKNDIFNFNTKPTRAISVYGADLGYPLVHNDLIKLDLYSQYSQIQGYGWGMTLPGASLSIGSFFNITAEYRKQSKEFVYGYFNQTYEFERAVFGGDPKNPITKDMTLKTITEGMSGFYLGMNLNFFDFASVTANYSDMTTGGSMNRRSLYGEASLKKKLIPGINEAKAYYVQNNVQDFQQWKTPSTILGYILEYQIGSAGVGFEYRYNFKNNEKGEIETLKTILLRTSIKF